MSSAPVELSVESVREFMVRKGGTVTNNELVKHFKIFLTNPETKHDARIEFKHIVNQIATVARDANGEKYLILKVQSRISPSPSSASSASCSTIRIGTPPNLHLNIPKNPSSPTNKHPPPYRSPPPVYSPVYPLNSTRISSDELYTTPIMSPAVDMVTVRTSSLDEFPKQQDFAPQAPPRRKSLDKIKDKENQPEEQQMPDIVEEHHVVQEKKEEPGRKISVKECMQKFQKMASESSLTNLPKIQQPISRANRKRVVERGSVHKDDEDTSSVHSFDAKSREWFVRAAQGNYQELVKLASENRKFVRYKTALHWGAKHGNQDIIKLIAGTYCADVNARTGYTPLHIAMQFGHEDVYNLLVQVYGADQNLRDWSGKKARQYQKSQNTSVSADTFQKIQAQKKHSEKDSGFLRIGSLNVRVKKTTEAFSNFLGVGQSSMDKLHKTWGSADNIEDYNKMPPPKFTPVKKHKSRSAKDFNIRGSPSSPRVVGKKKEISDKSDSDSDTAFGFDSNWRQES